VPHSSDEDRANIVAQSVAASCWADRYPIEPVAQEELDAIIANNDVVTAQLDAAGVAYERRTDELDYESIDYDYDDPAAQSAGEAAWIIISPSQPPTGAELEQQTELNNTLMMAFDAAGVPYELVTDPLGWAWVEWDTSDVTIAQRYDDIINEVYPPITIDPIVGCEVLEGPIELPQPDPNVAPTEPAEPIGNDAVNAQPGILPVEPELAVQDAAQREAEITSMINGFNTAAVEFDVPGESPSQLVVFDITDDTSVPVVASILAARP
jgi:hypothetical protein